MKRPATVKNWLKQPERSNSLTEIKWSTLEYIIRLEKIVALYTERDGVLPGTDHRKENRRC